MEVQVFGTKKNAETRKALRFFAERRIRTHFVDLNERAASLGELRRFAQKFGVASLIGLSPARFGDERWLEILADEPLLLRQPLVRSQQKLTLGLDEASWKEWTQR